MGAKDNVRGSRSTSGYTAKEREERRRNAPVKIGTLKGGSRIWAHGEFEGRECLVSCVIIKQNVEEIVTGLSGYAHDTPNDDRVCYVSLTDGTMTITPADTLVTVNESESIARLT